MYRDLLSVYDFPGPRGAVDVSVVGTTAFIIDRNLFQVIDVQDPQNPVLIGEYEELPKPIRVCVENDRAYVVCEDLGVVVLDVSDKTNPQLIGRYAEGTDVLEIQIKDSVAYIAVGYQGLKILSFENPAEPHILGVASVGQLVEDLYFDDDSTLLVVGGDRMGVYNVSDPSSPDLISVYEDLDSVSYVTASGSTVYAINDYELVTIDLSNLANPVQVDSIDLNADLREAHVVGNKLYIASLSDGMFVVDISVPASPKVLRSYSTLLTSPIRGLAVVNSIAYVASAFSGLFILDVQNPQSDPLIGRWDSDGLFGGIVLDEDVAYISRGSSGVGVLDVSNPAMPSLIMNIPVEGEAGGIAVSDGYLYIVDNYDQGSSGGGQCVLVFEIEDVGDLKLVGSYKFENLCVSIVVRDSIMYLTGGEFGRLGYLEIVDYSSKKHPVLLSNFAVPSIGTGLVVENGIVYLNALYTGLYILDTSELAQPLVLGTYSLGFAGSLKVNDGIAYIGALSSIELIDVRDLSAPKTVGVIRKDNTSVVEIVGDRALVPLYSILEIYDVSDPTDPTVVGSYETPDEGGARQGTDARMIGSTVFYVDRYNGLFVLNSADCTRDCLGDLNEDGRLNFFDITMFLAAFANEDPIADFTNDGRWNFFDVSQFLEDFVIGCS